ncbi:hypothetical protein [Qipengyuania marisflavi]|uniref:Uncharacterized protein n=1 Tax=Qipengyuania marisflavi TaxID=2486356 RepID=A0A5S3P793_9SPHN|nr:hypothetical protein [Qipengyuania marisflavi]TMM48892.1 hypothetical protein FEV51_05775 [Qipengyuania marisflavi]
MKRAVIIGLVAAALAVGAWFVFGGGLDRVAQSRIETALVANGLPQPMAACMATRLTERLTVVQLRKLERLEPEEGESVVPTNLSGLLERVRRIDDPEVIEVAASSAAMCAFGMASPSR